MLVVVETLTESVLHLGTFGASGCLNTSSDSIPLVVFSEAGVSLDTSGKSESIPKRLLVIYIFCDNVFVKSIM